VAAKHAISRRVLLQQIEHASVCRDLIVEVVKFIFQPAKECQY